MPLAVVWHALWRASHITVRDSKELFVLSLSSRLILRWHCHFCWSNSAWGLLSPDCFHLRWYCISRWVRYDTNGIQGRKLGSKWQGLILQDWKVVYGRGSEQGLRIQSNWNMLALLYHFMRFDCCWMLVDIISSQYLDVPCSIDI